MSLTPGSKLGTYEIVSKLGEGGMGQVFRARDTRLGRDVALKILPELAAGDPDRLARFDREARALAALNHPNIAHIYGVESDALIMELVEGEDLSALIKRGALPWADARPIARQVCEALEAAHEQGIIHRDLKPANIKIRPGGTVKVLDFGLAKLVHPESAGGAADASASPTITSPAMMTGVGVLLGTAAYMAPEQARGHAADRRSDIWAFGCVLYEMLTGKAPFAGDDVSDTLANVLKREPDWTALPSENPAAIRTLLQSCLAKDPRRRVGDMSTALFVLQNAATFMSPAGGVSAPLPRRPPWRRIGAPVATMLVASAVAGSGTWLAMRPADRVSPPVSRLLIAPSGVAGMTFNAARDLAITPDGSRVIYVANRGTQLFVRAL